MVEATLDFLPNATRAAVAPPERVALLGNPNCGKTALFNLLTGSRQKVANYAGVTVERKEGRCSPRAGKTVLRARPARCLQPQRAARPTSAVTRDVLSPAKARAKSPDLVVCVTDATNLRLNLRLVLEASETRPADGGGAQHDRHGRKRAASRSTPPCSRASSACR
jgi:ferrous iron transport protein B